MRFINRGEPIRIRNGELKSGYHWITLKTGETIELPEAVGKAKGLDVIFESKAGPVKVETKQINSGGEDGKK